MNESIIIASNAPLVLSTTTFLLDKTNQIDHETGSYREEGEILPIDHNSYSDFDNDDMDIVSSDEADEQNGKNTTIKSHSKQKNEIKLLPYGVIEVSSSSNNHNDNDNQITGTILPNSSENDFDEFDSSIHMFHANSLMSDTFNQTFSEVFKQNDHTIESVYETHIVVDDDDDEEDDVTILNLV